MTITIRLFAILRDRAGISELAMEVPEGATVATTQNALWAQYPALGDWRGRVAFAVNRSYSPLETELHDGDEVAVIPPVSGG